MAAEFSAPASPASQLVAGRRPAWYVKYLVDVPEGRSGEWAVQKFNLTQADSDFTQLLAFKNRNARDYVPPGDYTRLVCGRDVIMSDTPTEISEHREALFAAFRHGHCLVNGLGLGMVANGMLLNGADRVTVIEKSPDVISLVADHWRQKWGDKLEIIEADAFTYKPPKGLKYSYVWHDIWPTICGDNLPEMHTLHRRYGRRCASQNSWARRETERLAHCHCR